MDFIQNPFTVCYIILYTIYECYYFTYHYIGYLSIFQKALNLLVSYFHACFSNISNSQIKGTERLSMKMFISALYSCFYFWGGPLLSNDWSVFILHVKYTLTDMHFLEICVPTHNCYYNINKYYYCFNLWNDLWKTETCTCCFKTELEKVIRKTQWINSLTH